MSDHPSGPCRARRWRRPAVILSAALAVVPACHGKEARRELETTAPSAAPAVRPPPPVTPTATPPQDGWYVGTWTGSYQSVPHRIELPPAQGGLPEWKVEGKTGTGPGTLTLVASADGTVTGHAEGPLGKQEVRGAFEEGVLSARLVSAGASSGYSGTLVARRDGDRVVGTFEAGSTDGHEARTGTITLEKSTR